MNTQSHQRYEFGPFQVDTAEHSLLRDGKPVPLTPKVFDLLKVLVQNNGRLVEKDELLKEVWPDSFVEEGNLNRNISILRKVLGEQSAGVPYIETIPKRGYRFVANVNVRTVGNGSGTLDTEVVEHDSPASDPVRLADPDSNAQSGRTLTGRRWLVLGGLGALLLGIGGYALVHWGARNPLKPEIKSLAVLPLQNLSSDPSQEYFADGMTEALIGRLAQIRSLRVISRTSAMSFKRTNKPLPPLPEIARQLKVEGVIEGSVQRENGRVKVMIQLIHGPTDTHLWVRNYERALTDILKLQDEMARAIADEIRIQVTPEDRARMSAARAVNPAAHEAYLLGRFHFWKFIVDDHKRAIKHFERAIQIDPGYAPAYAGLSMAWQMLRIQGGMKGVDTQARAAAQKALELDDRLAEAHVAQANLQFRDWDWKGAENSIRRALELDSNNLDAHFYYSLVHLAVGRLTEAIAEIQTAEQLDPLSHQVQANFGRILLHAGRLEEALRRVKQAIEREPRSANAHMRLAAVYEAMGRYPEALESYDKNRVLRGDGLDNPIFRLSVAKVHARMGKSSEAKRMFKVLKKEVSRSDFGAGFHAAVGDKDEAFRLLFNMVEKREGNYVFVGTDPQFASLHSDPRWGELLCRMNFPAK